jgi:hypothetical protein
MKRIIERFLPLLFVFILLGCASTPSPKTNARENGVGRESDAIESVPVVKPVTGTVDEKPFDPSTITKEVYDTAKIDVQELIARLNGIIRERDYEGWVTYLGSTYRGSLSDPTFLQKVSGSVVLRKQNVTLRELKDYFIHVVVPSRANDRVDDIEFIGQNRVKAFTVDSKGRRLRLYDLEKDPSGWKIVS